MSRPAYETANGLLAAARDAGLDERVFHQLPGWRAAELLDQVLDTFTRTGRGGRMRYWIWEDLGEPSLSLGGSHDVELLATLRPPSSKVWLIVEDFDASKGGAPFWLFETALGAIPIVLRNHPLVEFYVVSRGVSWLVCENHHGAWFASGAHAVATLKPTIPVTLQT
jgi:hypothetical protein